MDARATTSMRIKLKYPDLETFIQKYAVNISRGGIFIATRAPKPVGTVVRFEFLLGNAEATSLIRGEGVVQWTREYDPATPTKAHGMGVKFTRLDAESQSVVDRALHYRASMSGSKKGDSEGISVAAVSPPGATPEPTPLPSRDDEAIQFRTHGRAREERQERQDDDEVPTRNVALPPERPPQAERALPAERPLPTERSLPSLEDPHDEHPLGQFTRPVSIPDSGPAGRAAEQETRPIQMPDSGGGDTTGEVQLPSAAPMMVQSVDDSVRIALERHRQPRNGRRHGDELDQLISDWNLSLEQVEQLIKRKRPRMGAQATAELERLLRRPPRPPAVSKAEAIQLLDALLTPTRAAVETAAAGGEAEPQAGPDGPQSRKRKRAR
jgi:uncharacterized protein (TIGR02266 family)